MYIYIYIYIYIHVYVYLCVYIYIYIYGGVVSSWILSSENMSCTRSSSWGIQWDLNLLVFVVWMVFTYVFFMNADPSIFLECSSLSLLYPSFTFDIWRSVYVCLWVCVCMCVLKWFQISLILIFLCVCVCVNIFLEIFFLCVLIGIILNLPRIHCYRCFETCNFLFPSILILLLCSDVLVLRACVDPMYISLHSQHSIV